MENKIVTKEDVDCVARMARAFAASGLFGFKSEADAFALMSVAQANGLHPAKAVERYHTMNGKVSMKSEAMLASFQEAGGKIKWIKRSNTECTLHLEHPQGGELDVTWDIARAKAAGLTGKNTWQQFPAQMLSARCVSEGVRALFPACLCGMYTPEEVADMTTDSTIKKTEHKVENEKQVPKIDNSSVVDAEIVDKKTEQNENTKNAEEDVKVENKEVVEQQNTSENVDKDREAFVKSMEKLEKKQPQIYKETLGSVGYESADDVPAEKRMSVYNTVYLAVKSNCKKI